MPGQIDIRYNSERHILRMAFGAEHCAGSPSPPPDIFQRAKGRFEAARQQGLIGHYVLYQDRLRSVWTVLHEETKRNPGLKRDVILTIGAGYPDLPGLELKPSADAKAMAVLSLNVSRSLICQWRTEWVQLAVEQKLIELGVAGRPDPAQVRAEVFRAREGMQIRNVPLYSVDHLVKASMLRGAFNLLHNKSRGEVVLVINDLEKMKNIDMVKFRLNRVEDKLRQLNWRDKESYKLLKLEVVKAIGRAVSGHQGFGVGMPVVILAAIRKQTPKPVLNRSASIGSAAAAHKKERDLISFSISDDEMQATITAVHEKIFAQKNFSEGDLRVLCEKAGITAGILDDALTDAVTKIAIKENIAGVVIASGKRAKGGAKAYLCTVANGLDSGIDSVRTYSQQPTVKKGQLVAETRFEEPPALGYTVKGQPTKAKVSGLIEVPCGEGIKRDDEGKYYAEYDGLLVQDDVHGLSLKKFLVHTGDVSLASGDIDFDGPVEISGDIDSGVRVFAGGDLIVKGEIRGGRVHCRGNLLVERGIVLGPTGSIYVHGDVQADFIENSTISCGGTLRAKKSILSSRIMAAKAIEIESSTGVIAGGSFTFGDLMRTAKLGLDDGAKTEVLGGVDFKREMLLTRRRQRLENLTLKASHERAALKELTKKRPNQLTKANKQQKSLLTSRIRKWKKLIALAQRLVDVAAASNAEHRGTEAKAFVSGSLSVNCMIKMGGMPVPLTQTRTAVVVSSVAGTDGSMIQPYSGAGPEASSVKKAG